MNKQARRSSATPLPAPEAATTLSAQPNLFERLLDISVPDIARGILLAFMFALPFIFDLQVPEVSGDIRWTAIILVSGLLVLLGCIELWHTRKITFRWPLLLWVGLALFVWSGISIIDAIDRTRGIMPMKALAGQLILMTAAYILYTPTFARRMVWAMILPLAFTSFVGICQFFVWRDAMAANWLQGIPLFGPLLGWVWGHIGFIDWIQGYFLQSAVPGSTFANKNLAGSWTAMVLPLTLLPMFTSTRVSHRAVASFLFAFGLLFLVYSRSRASWLALMVGLGVLAVLVALSPELRRTLGLTGSLKSVVLSRLVWLVPAVLALALFGGALGRSQGSYAIDRSPVEQMHALTKGTWNEMGGRIAYNVNGIAITKDYWFNGVGLGNFYSIYPAYNKAWVATPMNSYSIMARPQRTHNDMMQAFTETGIPGGILYVMLPLLTFIAAWSLRSRRALAQTGAVPVILSTSVLVISVNALMDFPMQLPTAPAFTAVLMGILMAAYHRAEPEALMAGPRGSLRFPRPAVLLAALVATGAWLGTLYECHLYREENKVLKYAMIRVMSGIVDDETVAILNAANRIYPYDPRVNEHMGVVYANYRGNQQWPIEDRIAGLENVLKQDPWGANHTVNLAGILLGQAETYLVRGDQASAKHTLDKIEDLYRRLQLLADTSEFTWGVGGTLRLLQMRPDAALPLFERALAINPAYEPAKAGVARARALISASEAAMNKN